MSDTMTHPRDRRAAHLRNLRDHPSTSAEERAAAEEALRRLGADEPQPVDDQWRAQMCADFDARIISIELQIIEAEHAAETARAQEAHARRTREAHEAVLADLQQQLAHQQAWRRTVS